MNNNPRPGDGLPTILVIGHARHGKDTVCEMLEAYGFRFVSSSEFVGREIIFDRIGHEYAGDFDAMFDDRVNRREEWFKFIEEYNTPDETRTGRTMLERGYHLYCGMRRKEELEACVAAGLFDMIWWVDRSLHLPPEDESSNTLDLTHVTHFINNNGTLADLSLEVHKALCRGTSE